MECKPYHLLFLSDASYQGPAIAPLLAQSGVSARITKVDSLEDSLFCILQDKCDGLILDGSASSATYITQFLRRCAPHLPLIVLVDERDPQADWLNLQEGGVEFLTRQGITAEGLKRTIRRVMDRHESIHPRGVRISKSGHASHDSEISDLTWELVHELSQPLTAIANFAEAGVQAARSNNGRTEYLKQTLDTVAELAQQASRIMECLRKLTLGEPVRCEQVAVNETVSSVVNQLKPEAERREARLCLALEPNLPFAWSNGVQLAQALLNIGKNALEAVTEVALERRDVQVETACGQDMVCIIVSDRGKGMSRQAMARICEPRFTTKPVGMGIGLSISRAMVESMGGSLEWKSQEGVGSAFRIMLPIAERR